MGDDDLEKKTLEMFTITFNFTYISPVKIYTNFCPLWKPYSVDILSCRLPLHPNFVNLTFTNFFANIFVCVFIYKYVYSYVACVFVLACAYMYHNVYV